MTSFSPVLDSYPILVLPHQRALGYGKALQGVWSKTAYPVLTARDALTSRHETDAHLALYLLKRRSDGKWTTTCPRLTKDQVEWELEARRLDQLGLDVRVCLFAADFDTKESETGLPNHAKLAELPDGGVGWLAEKKRQLESLSPKYQFARYTTRAGGRILAPLSVPLTPAAYEVLSQVVVADLRSAGVSVDKIEHWTALFRLPEVRRRIGTGNATEDLRSRTSFGHVSAIDSAPFVGSVAEFRIGPEMRRVVVPALEPLPAGVDVWSLVGWSGIEETRDRLVKGEPIGDPAHRYDAFREAVASVSARMDEPRADVVERIFERSLEAMRLAGSRGTVETMPAWIAHVTERDREKKTRDREESQDIVRKLSRSLSRQQQRRPFAAPHPGADAAALKIVRDVVEEAKKVIARVKGMKSLFNACVDVGRVASWLSVDGAVKDLAAHVPEKLRTDEGEKAMRDGIELGRKTPRDVRGEVARRAVEEACAVSEVES